MRVTLVQSLLGGRETSDTFDTRGFGACRPGPKG